MEKIFDAGKVRVYDVFSLHVFSQAPGLRIYRGRERWTETEETSVFSRLRQVPACDPGAVDHPCASPPVTCANRCSLPAPHFLLFIQHRGVNSHSVPRKYGKNDQQDRNISQCHET